MANKSMSISSAWNNPHHDGYWFGDGVDRLKRATIKNTDLCTTLNPKKHEEGHWCKYCTMIERRRSWVSPDTKWKCYECEYVSLPTDPEVIVIMKFEKQWIPSVETTWKILHEMKRMGFKPTMQVVKFKTGVFGVVNGGV